MDFSDESNIILSHTKRFPTSLFEHQMNLNMFIFWKSNSTPYFWLWMSGHQTLLDLLKPSLNSVEHHFFEHWTDSNISIPFGNWTRTPFFWLRMNGHWTSNLVRSITNRPYRNSNFDFLQKVSKGWKYPSSLFEDLIAHVCVVV